VSELRARLAKFLKAGKYRSAGPMQTLARLVCEDDEIAMFRLPFEREPPAESNKWDIHKISTRPEGTSGG